MPPFQDKEYLKKIHGALMSAYGPDGGYSKGNFNLSMDEFSQKVKDKNYASKIYGALDGAYGNNGGYSKGNFSLGFDDFYKKAVGGQAQQAVPQAQPAKEDPQLVKVKTEYEANKKRIQDGLNDNVQGIADSFKVWMEIAADAGDKAWYDKLKAQYDAEVAKKEKGAQAALDKETDIANKKIESLYGTGSDLQSKKRGVIAHGQQSIEKAKQELIDLGFTEEELEGVDDENKARELVKKVDYLVASNPKFREINQALVQAPAAGDNTRVNLGPNRLPAGMSAPVSKSVQAKQALEEIIADAKNKKQKIGMLRAAKLASQNITASPRDIGAEAMKIMDPDRYSVWKKTGFTEPEMARAAEEIGITALASTGDDAVADLLVKDLESIDDRFPEQDIAITRHMIAAKAYEQSGAVRKFLGKNWSVDAMDEAAKALPEKYRRVYEKFIRPEEKALGMGGTMMPNWGISKFGSSFLANVGAIIDPGFTKSDREIARGALSSVDKTDKEAVGENNALIQRRRALSRKLYNEGELTGSETQELDVLSKSEKALGSAQRFLDGSSDVAGNVLAFGAVARAIGAPLKVLGMSKKAADVVGLISSGYLASNESSAQEAMLEFPDDPAKRFVYKQIIQWSQALSEMVFRDTKVIDAFKRGIAPKAAAIARSLSSSEINSSALKSTISQLIKDGFAIAGATLDNANKEAIEEVLPFIPEIVSKAIMAPDKVDMAETTSKAWDTYATMMVEGLIVGGVGGYNDFKMNRVTAPFLASIGRQGLENYTASIEKAIIDLEQTGEITAEEANEKRQIFADISAANQAMDQMLKVAKVGLSGRARDKVVLMKANIDALQRKVLQLNDPALAGPILEEINKLNKMRADIIAGNLFVSEDGAVKTPEVAAKEMLSAEVEDVRRAISMAANKSKKEFRSLYDLIPKKEQPTDGSKTMVQVVAEAYHKAKATGTNQKLVDAVEQFAPSVIATSPEEIQVQDDGVVVEKHKAAVVAEPDAVEPEAVPTVEEIIGEPIVYDGMRGRVYVDGQQLIFKKDGADTEYEIGNAEELGKMSINDAGISQEENVVGFDDSGNITVRGKSYVNNFSDPLMAINRDENGDIVSVNLETPDGKKRTFRGAEAEDIAYNIQLKKITENNAERQAFEEFINTDEEARAEVESGAVQEPATVDSAEADAQVQSESATTEAELDKQVAEQVKAATKPELELQDMEDSDFDKLSSFEMEKKAKQRDRIMRDNERLQKLIDCIWS